MLRTRHNKNPAYYYKLIQNFLSKKNRFAHFPSFRSFNVKFRKSPAVGVWAQRLRFAMLGTH